MGEALIDIIVATNGEVDSVVGGAPVNTARTLARLGRDVSFLGGISGDAFGQRITRLLKADGVELALSASVPEPSTIAIASLDESGAATYRFLIENTSASSVTTDLALSACDLSARAIHVGTLGLVLQPLSQAVCAVVDAMREHQILMVDPNARPSVMSNSAIFEQNFSHVLKRADVVKVSGEDLQFIYPELETREAAFTLHSSTGAIVLLTLGADSVHIYAGGDVLAIEVPAVHVVDTVGAGDAFSGGFLAFWDQHNWGRAELGNHNKVEQAVRFGIRVAGLTCSAVGAQPPFADQL